MQKVTGRARYTFDVQLPGMLYARRVVSDVPHARITSIDTSAAESHPGVRAVHVLDRVLLRRSCATRRPRLTSAIPPCGMRASRLRAWRRKRACCRGGCTLVKVEYEPLPHVTTLDEAMQTDAPAVFPGPTEQAATAGGGGAVKGLPQQGNVRGPDTPGSLPSGDVVMDLPKPMS